MWDRLSQFKISVVAAMLKQLYYVVKALASILLFIDPHEWMLNCFSCQTDSLVRVWFLSFSRALEPLLILRSPQIALQIAGVCCEDGERFLPEQKGAVSSPRQVLQSANI